MKNKKLSLAVLVLGSMLAQGAWAADAVQLSIDEAIVRAFQTNPDVKIAGYQLDKGRAGMNAAREKCGLSVSVDHNTSRGGYRDTWDASHKYRGPGNSHSNKIGASVPLFTGGANSGNIMAAEAGYRSALAGKQKAYNDMYYNVTAAYYDCLLTKDLERVAQESVKTLSEHLRHVQDSYDVGVVAKIDVLRSEVEMADAEQNLIKAENTRKLAVHTLNKMIGLPLETELNLTDTLQFEAYDKGLAYCLDFAQTNRPELEQARQGVKSARGGLRVAKSGHMPKISGQIFQSWGGNGKDWPGDDDPNWGAGVNVSWNVFDSGATLSNIHAAEADKKIALEKLRDSEDSVLLDVRNTYYTMNEAERRIQTTKAVVSKAEEDYAIAKLCYENGVGTNTDVLDAQVALTQAKTNYIQACYDFSTAKIALDNAIGVPYKSPLDKKSVVSVQPTKSEQEKLAAEKTAAKAAKKAAKNLKKAAQAD